MTRRDFEDFILNSENIFVEEPYPKPTHHYGGHPIKAWEATFIEFNKRKSNHSLRNKQKVQMKLNGMKWKTFFESAEILYWMVKLKINIYNGP